MGKQKEVFSLYRGEFRNTHWNKGQLDQALDDDLDHETEFAALSAEFCKKQKEVFSLDRGEFRNAHWNKGQLDQALDDDLDYETEFAALSAEFCKQKEVFSLY